MRTGNILSISLCLLGLTACAALKPITTPEPSTFEPQKNNKLASYYNVEMGVTYLEQANVPLAKEKLLLALKQQPKSAMALEAMGYYYEVTGEEKTANDYYINALKAAPKSGRALNNYGAFLCRTGHYKEAEAYFQKAVNDKNYINTAAVYENAGLCEIGIPNYDKAEYYFKQALLRDPKRKTSIYELAKLYYKQGKYGYAQKYLSDLQALSEPTSATRWLGIKIAKAKNRGKTKFSNSKQAKLYQKMQII